MVPARGIRNRLDARCLQLGLAPPAQVGALEGSEGDAVRRGEKAKRLIWRDNQPFNFKPGDMKELEDELEKSGETERSARSDAKLAG